MTPRAGDIGPAREIEYEPFPESVPEPVHVPAPTPAPAPAEPEKVPA